MKVEIFDVQRASFVDGPGIRTVIFFKGCNLRCKWCHNPESQSFKPELLIFADRCTHCGICNKVCEHKESCISCGKCVDFCESGARKIFGYTSNTEELINMIRRDKSFYDSSGGGVTFSGGECLLQPEPLRELLKACREYGIKTAVDTAGNIDTETMREFSGLTDLFLYDVKHMNNEKHRSGTGVSNELILKNLAMLLQMCPEKVIIRVPIISGYNDDIHNAFELRNYIAENGKPLAVELLPYHRLGESKYAAMGRTYENYAIPSEEKMKILNSYYNE